jgi:class 3 adenylate cyclase
MSHFDVLRQAVAAEGGAVVKTMGDAVMASFIGAGPAVRAAIAAHRLLETQAGAGVAPLRLKAAVHFGPCIAVTLNDRLDYFGSTVNIAARLVTAADAGEVVVSDEALADPSLASLLSAGSVVCAHGPRRCTFKGVEGERAAHPLIPGAAWSECPP